MEGGGGGACVAWWVLLCAQSNKGGQGKPARSRPFLLSRAPNKTAMVRRGGGAGGGGSWRGNFPLSRISAHGF